MGLFYMYILLYLKLLIFEYGIFLLLELYCICVVFEDLSIEEILNIKLKYVMMKVCFFKKRLNLCSKFWEIRIKRYRFNKINIF